VRITGIRSWIGFSNSFASVVMIVQVSSSSPPVDFHELPQAHEPERLSVLEHDPERLFRAPSLLPLVEAIGRYEAPPLAERDPEGRLSSDGLSTGVNHPVADRRVLRPRRDETPAHLCEIALPVVAHHDHRLHGGDIVAWSDLLQEPSNPEPLGDGSQVRGEGESPAHGSARFTFL
jgi:hypothetical protein